MQWRLCNCCEFYKHNKSPRLIDGYYLLNTRYLENVKYDTVITAYVPNRWTDLVARPCELANCQK